MAGRPMSGQGEFEMTTPDGSLMNEATTAMIKALRRGRELEALYWANQLEAQYHKYLWRRLLIFASEDVNIGNPHAVVQVRALADNYAQIKAESKNPVVDRSILTMAVMVLARSPKSRECDDLLNVIDHLRGQYGWRAPWRDETFDLHTREGKRRWPRQARLRHWVEAASHEENRVGPRDWHLWLLKWGAQRGVYDVEWVKDLALQWDERGWLMYGVDGLPIAQVPWEDVEPEFPGLEPAAPELDDDLWPVDKPWVWTCTTCKTPLDHCDQGSEAYGPCCDHCTHNPPNVTVDPGVK